MSHCTAADLKNEGNLLFTARKYKDAIACYSKAIIRDPSVASYYTNRALCHTKLKQWEQACQDCQRALETDQQSIKAHYFLGVALYELQLYDESIASLSRAYDLSKDQRQNFGEDITVALRHAKKKKWSLEEEKRLGAEVELEAYLSSLMSADRERRVENIMDTKDLDDCERQSQLDQLEREHESRINELSQLFSQVDDRRKRRDVPDVLCSRISFCIMRDPVITPSGISYERKDIVEHLQRLGHFDPVTRKELKQEQLVPNLALKEVVDNFLTENPWAEDY